MSIQIFNRMQAIKKLLLLILCSFGFYLTSLGQVNTKASLDHTVYDGWQEIGTKEISNNGGWVAFTIKPQEGNEQLVVYNVLKRTKLNISRSSEPVFTADNQFLLFRIQPAYEKENQTKKDKKKKNQSHIKDTPGILNLKRGIILKNQGLISFQVPKKRVADG